MALQTCGHCKRELPEEEFHKNKGRKESWCKSCRAEYDRERTLELRQEVKEYFGSYCYLCNQEILLNDRDFAIHHVKGDSKKATALRVKEDWYKCVLLCTTCHRIIHNLARLKCNPDKLKFLWSNL